MICSSNETFCPTCQRIVLTTEFPRCHQRVPKRPVASTTAEQTVTEPEPTSTTVPPNTIGDHSLSDNGTEYEDEATICSFCNTCNKMVMHQTKENGSCHGPCVYCRVQKRHVSCMEVNPDRTSADGVPVRWCETCRAFITYRMHLSQSCHNLCRYCHTRVPHDTCHELGSNIVNLKQERHRRTLRTLKNVIGWRL